MTTGSPASKQTAARGRCRAHQKKTARRPPGRKGKGKKGDPIRFGHVSGSMVKVHPVSSDLPEVGTRAPAAAIDV